MDRLFSGKKGEEEEEEFSLPTGRKVWYRHTHSFSVLIKGRTKRERKALYVYVTAGATGERGGIEERREPDCDGCASL